MFKHKRHLHYVVQDAVIMRKLNRATYNNDDEILDLLMDLSLQVQGYAGKLREYVDQQEEDIENQTP